MKVMFLDESGDHSKENKAFLYIEKKFHRNPKGIDYLNYGLKIFP